MLKVSRNRPLSPHTKDTLRPFTHRGLNTRFGVADCISLNLIAVRRISSKTTVVWKRVFPVVWFGFLGFFLLSALLPMLTKKEIHIEFVIIPLIMAGFGFFVMKRLVFDLADEVWDEGDALLVRVKGKEERVALSNIINVSHSSFTNPPRVTLTLREPCSLGREIAFFPPHRVFLWSKDPIVAELIERIDAKRRNG
jgi:hypothetical protein